MGNVKATKDPRPKRPRVDKGLEFEQKVREAFKLKVDDWCKSNKDQLDEQPTKDDKGNVVDNLTASFTSGFETMFEAATDSYLSTVVGLDDDEDEDEEEGDEDGDEDDEEESR